ncbi:TPA: hypothetical protein NIG05_006453 [Pseudomonas aeruginosa]|nr:hypothetical protein [Pseudomonas aeruginosa]
MLDVRHAGFERDIQARALLAVATATVQPAITITGHHALWKYLDKITTKDVLEFREEFGSKE